MKGDRLGEFEELVLLTVYGLGSEAYGVSILEKLEEDSQRTFSIGAVYAALSRLENLILHETDPEAWVKTVRPRATNLAIRWADLAEEDGPDRTAVLAEIYRLSSEVKLCRGPRRS